MMLLLLTPLLCAQQSSAPPAFRLPQIFGSNMLLQRDTPWTVWGWATPGSKVTAVVASSPSSIRAGAHRETPGDTGSTTRAPWFRAVDRASSSAGPDGTFTVTMSRQPAGVGGTLTVMASGTNGGHIKLTNLAFGDSYFCSGQVIKPTHPTRPSVL
jgi:hypothetical protein